MRKAVCGELFDGGVKGVHKKESPAAVPSLLTSRSPKSSREVTVREGWKGGKSAAITVAKTISLAALLKRHMRANIIAGGLPPTTGSPQTGTRRGLGSPRVWGLFFVDYQKERRPKPTVVSPFLGRPIARTA